MGQDDLVRLVLFSTAQHTTCLIDMHYTDDCTEDDLLHHWSNDTSMSSSPATGSMQTSVKSVVEKRRLT